MNALQVDNRNYPIRRPLAAFLAGAAVALLGGLIGLGGAEFRLPLLIMVFSLFPHRAIRINLLISLATLATAAVVRLQVTQDTQVPTFMPEIIAMSLGGIIAAWIGAGLLSKFPKHQVMSTVAVLLGGISILLVVETIYAGGSALALPADSTLRIGVALVAGLLVGSVSSLLGIAGGEFIIPILIFIFGADIKTAGTASVLIAIPIVLAGVARHIRAGRFRSESMLLYLVLPMSVGSIFGALVGGYISAWAPTFGLRILLAAILFVSACKMWQKGPRIVE